MRGSIFSSSSQWLSENFSDEKIFFRARFENYCVIFKMVALTVWVLTLFQIAI